MKNQLFLLMLFSCMFSNAQVLKSKNAPVNQPNKNTQVKQPQNNSDIKITQAAEEVVIANDYAEVADGVYRIKIAENDLQLGFKNDENALEKGAKLIQWQKEAGNHLLFRIMKAGKDNSYTIQSLNSNLYLDVFSFETADNTKVVQWENTNTANQKWYFKPTAKGTYEIVSKHAKKRLQLLGDNPWWSGWGQPLVIGSDNRQTFVLQPENNVYKYEEIYTLSNLQLNVSGGDDSEMYGEIRAVIKDRFNNTYNRYYLAQRYYAEWFFFRNENQQIDMSKNRTLNLDNTLAMRLRQDEVLDATISLVFDMREDDGEISFQYMGGEPDVVLPPNEYKKVNTNIDKGHLGADDFYILKPNAGVPFQHSNSNNVITFKVSDLPVYSNIHVKMQDEDGSDNFMDIYFTIKRERVFK